MHLPEGLSLGECPSLPDPSRAFPKKLIHRGIWLSFTLVPHLRPICSERPNQELLPQQKICQDHRLWNLFDPKVTDETVTLANIGQSVTSIWISILVFMAVEDIHWSAQHWINLVLVDKEKFWCWPLTKSVRTQTGLQLAVYGGYFTVHNYMSTGPQLTVQKAEWGTAVTKNEITVASLLLFHKWIFSISF